MAIGTLAALGVPSLDAVITLLSNSDELTRDAATFVLMAMTNPQNITKIDGASQAKLRAALLLVSKTASDPYMRSEASQGYASLPVPTAFSSFTAKFESCQTGSFQLNSRIALASNSNGINPTTEPIILQAGTLVLLIPAGRYQKQKNGNFSLEDSINGISIQSLISPLGNNAYSFRAEVSSPTLNIGPSPISLTVLIGDDAGTTVLASGCS